MFFNGSAVVFETTGGRDYLRRQRQETFALLRYILGGMGRGLSEMGADHGACRHWFSINGHGFMRSVTFHDFVCGVDRREFLDRGLFHLCRKFTRNEQVLPSNIRYIYISNGSHPAERVQGACMEGVSPVAASFPKVQTRFRLASQTTVLVTHQVAVIINEEAQ